MTQAVPRHCAGLIAAEMQNIRDSDLNLGSIDTGIAATACKKKQQIEEGTWSQ
jgi:hypothetical protein